MRDATRPNLRAFVLVSVLVGAASVALATKYPVGQRYRDNRVGDRPRGQTDDTVPYVPAFFEFAPDDGTGIGAACACTTPTGAAGELMTVTRASTAACTKGSETLLANGDLVICASGEPRVMPGGDGSGGPGINVWEGRTNVCIRNTALDNAAWSVTSGSGPVDPVVTANAGVGPDGVTNAERVDYPAVSGANARSFVYTLDPLAVTATPWTASVYVRGVSGVSDTGTVYLILTPEGVTFASVACAYVSTAWTRCPLPNQTLTAANWYVFLGVDLRDATQSAKPAQSVYLSRPQLENGSTVSPPIDSAGAATTRLREIIYLTLPTAPKSSGVYSMAATVSSAQPSSHNWQAVALETVATVPLAAMYNNGGVALSCQSYNATGIIATRAAAGAFTDTRIVCFNDGVNEQGLYAGVAFATPALGTRTAPLAKRVYLGSDPASGFEINGTVKRVCIDPVDTRCR